jgi:hypothetical protein
LYPQAVRIFNSLATTQESFPLKGMQDQVAPLQVSCHPDTVDACCVALWLGILSAYVSQRQQGT